MKVVGVDGFRRGWVAVVLVDGSFAEAVASRSFADIRTRFDDSAVIAVDIPIGLSEGPIRAADAAAKEFLRPRGSAVFATYPEALYRAGCGLPHRERYAEARALCRAQGWPVISSQSFALGVRILELAAWTLDPLVVEVHPEVSFLELAGAHLGHKKTWNGLMARRRALDAAGIELPERLPDAAGVPADDVLDAGVAAWSAERYASGRAEPLPAGHSRGVPGAIWR